MRKKKRMSQKRHSINSFKKSMGVRKKRHVKGKINRGGWTTAWGYGIKFGGGGKKTEKKRDEISAKRREGVVGGDSTLISRRAMSTE